MCKPWIVCMWFALVFYVGSFGFLCWECLGETFISSAMVDATWASASISSPYSIKSLEVDGYVHHFYPLPRIDVQITNRNAQRQFLLPEMHAQQLGSVLVMNRSPIWSTLCDIRFWLITLQSLFPSAKSCKVKFPRCPTMRARIWSCSIKPFRDPSNSSTYP